MPKRSRLKAVAHWISVWQFTLLEILGIPSIRPLRKERRADSQAGRGEGAGR